MSPVLVVTAVALAMYFADTSPASPGKKMPSKAAVKEALRKLWEEHVQWTRMVIISFAAGLPDFDAASKRLLANQDDLGAVIVPFYGQAAGDKLTALLKDHILIAVDVLKAAKAGDASALDAAKKRWYDNGYQIADFLSAANPKSWTAAAMRAAMREHLDTTLAEASARLAGKWDEDVTAYEKAREHVLMMADTLAGGIAAQFSLR